MSHYTLLEFDLLAISPICMLRERDHNSTQGMGDFASAVREKAHRRAACGYLHGKQQEPITGLF
jgi:hypothetical protein